LIINRYQDIEELTNLLEKEQYQNMDIILDTLDENKKQNVESDREILGYIHHALNLDQYGKKEFRKKLFEKIPPLMQKTLRHKPSKKHASNYLSVINICSNQPFNFIPIGILFLIPFLIIHHIF